MAVENIQPVCFIATPIGEENSSVRRATDGLLKATLCPILKEIGFSVIAPHEIPSPGSISSQIIEHLLNDKLVVANLTGLNPNVMYEVGVRHCVRLPLIMIAEQGTKTPFDIQDERILFYENDIAGSEEMKPRFKQMCEKALEDENKPDNQVYRVAKSNVMKEVMKNNDTDQYILERLDTIESHISQLRSSQVKEPASLVGYPHYIDIDGNEEEIIKLIINIIKEYPITTAVHTLIGNNKIKFLFRLADTTSSIKMIVEHIRKAGFAITGRTFKHETKRTPVIMEKLSNLSQ